jgi:hypothetical protein
MLLRLFPLLPITSIVESSQTNLYINLSLRDCTRSTLLFAAHPMTSVLRFPRARKAASWEGSRINSQLSIRTIIPSSPTTIKQPKFCIRTLIISVTYSLILLIIPTTLRIHSSTFTRTIVATSIPRSPSQSHSYLVVALECILVFELFPFVGHHLLPALFRNVSNLVFPTA